MMKITRQGGQTDGHDVAKNPFS